MSAEEDNDLFDIPDTDHNRNSNDDNDNDDMMVDTKNGVDHDDGLIQQDDMDLDNSNNNSNDNFHENIERQDNRDREKDDINDSNNSQNEEDRNGSYDSNSNDSNDESDSNDEDDEADGDGDADDDSKFSDAKEKFHDANDDIPKNTTNLTNPASKNDGQSTLNNNKERSQPVLSQSRDEDNEDKARQNSSNLADDLIDEDDVDMEDPEVKNKSPSEHATNEPSNKDSTTPDQDPDANLTPLEFRNKVIANAKRATNFDIVPSVAIPYTSQCHSLAFTDGPKWILTGGEDGFIRKYDFFSSIEGKSPLTMAQRHNLVDSVTKAGVIASYWENEQPLTKTQLMKFNPKLKPSDFSTGSVSYEPKINPVYSLDVERNGFWCLSGLLSGGISLYTMIYNEGFTHHYFHHGEKKRSGGATLDNGHNDTVSVLTLDSEQKKFLSGSWDKTIREWDLNTGKCTSLYSGSSGQISNVQYRPDGLKDVSISVEDKETALPSGSIINDNKNNDVKDVKNADNISSKPDNSDVDSLFGDDDEDDAAANDDDTNKAQERQDKPSPINAINNTKSNLSTKTYSNNNVFMSSSIDGTINIWDVRTTSAVLRLGLSEGIPPWCMSSTWSNDGEFIYAGRRNSTVEEVSIRMPHKRSLAGHHKETMVPNVSKLLQFPKISGPVSAISTMPNNDFLLCGSNDNIRLYNLSLYDNSSTASSNKAKQATPFLIIPGHHGGILSHLYCDHTGRFMVSASGNRGWGHSTYTDTVLVYEIDFES